MNTSTSPKDRPARTGARGGSRTGYKPIHYSKSAGTNESKPPSKQVNHKEQQDPSRPRSAPTDFLAGEHLIPQESIPDLYPSYKTSAFSGHRLGKSIPVVLNSGHDKILSLTGHVLKLSLKSTTSRQVVTCGRTGGNLNILSHQDPKPGNSEESKCDDAFLAGRMAGGQNLGRLKETININDCNKKAGVTENKREYLVTDDDSGLAVVAPKNGKSPELAASGDYKTSQSAERQRDSRRKPDISGYLDIYRHSTYSEASSIYSRDRTNLDWSESNSGLISDLCDIVREEIMESEMEDKEYFIERALTPMMRALVSRIIKELHIIFIPEWKADARQSPSRSSAASTKSAVSTKSSVSTKSAVSMESVASTKSAASTESTASTKSAASRNSSNGGPSSSTSGLSSLGKFAMNERDDELSNDDEEKLPKRPQDSDALSAEAEIGLGYACPFHKHDPKKYTSPDHRLCASTGWNSISRVKEHLYRCHRMAIHCIRCHKQFSSDEELHRHVRVPPSKVCELRLGETTEGITPEVEKQLKRRKKLPSKKAAEECWKAIYQLLFPKDETVPGPYFELPQCEHIVSNNYEDLAEFKKYSKLELPRLMRNQLETEFSLEEDLKCKLLSTVQQCQELLFSEYDAARRPSQTPSADSVTPSHYQAERGTADESQRSFPTRQVSDQLAPTSRLLPPQPIFDSSSMQGGSNLATIVERNGADVYTDSGYGAGIAMYHHDIGPDDFPSHYPGQESRNESHVHTMNVQLDIVGANNSTHDHPMLEAPDQDPEISRGASLGITGSEYGWDINSEEFNQMQSMVAPFYSLR